MKNVQLLLIFMALMLAGQSFAQSIPNVMNYQGKVMDVDGNPLEGQHSIVFSFYDAAQDGNYMWGEAHANVDVQDGIFNVRLGTVNAFPDDLWETNGLYLAINVNNDGDMLPRSLLTSVPFALNSQNGEDDDWVIDGENLIRENGKVGIGTDDPSATLEVEGTIKSTNTGVLGTGVMTEGSLFGVYATASGNGIYTEGGIYGIWAKADLSKSATAVAGYFDGKVGIGTIAKAQLDVAGGQICVRGKSTLENGTSLELAYSSTYNRGEIFAYDRSNDVYKDLRIDGSFIRINGSSNTGNVSIGTSENDGKLHIYNGSYPGPALFVEGGNGEEGDIAWNADEKLHMGTWNKQTDEYTNALTIFNTGNVSIGTNDNVGRLHIYNGNNPGPALYLQGGGANDGDIAWRTTEHLQMGMWDLENDTYTNMLTFYNNHKIHFFDDEGNKKLEFLSTESGTDGAQLTLYDSEGNAAIVFDTEHGGQPGDPARIQTETLEITGGSDLAEPFNMSHEGIEKGMLVSIDPENSGMIRLSTEAYDQCVAGVSSGANNINPGLILKQEGTVADGEVPVALTGRVYCKVDAGYGKIKPGDLLTSSNTPGHAMKAKNRRKSQGAIIGKAMTGLSEGKGFVLVLVSLQ